MRVEYQTFAGSVLSQLPGMKATPTCAVMEEVKNSSNGLVPIVLRGRLAAAATGFRQSGPSPGPLCNCNEGVILAAQKRGGTGGVQASYQGHGRDRHAWPS